MEKLAEKKNIQKSKSKVVSKPLPEIEEKPEEEAMNSLNCSDDGPLDI